MGYTTFSQSTLEIWHCDERYNTLYLCPRWIPLNGEHAGAALNITQDSALLPVLAMLVSVYATRMSNKADVWSIFLR